MAQRWPIIDVPLYDLALDLKNVRVPGGPVDEAAIAKYLVEADDLLGLLRDILRDGYIDNELPVVVKQDGKYIVQEGNRRVAVLKTIAQPSLVGSAAASVERLKSRHQEHEIPTLIRVMVAPDWAAAQPLLARLHTGQPKRSWIREQQAIFFHAQLTGTVTVDHLKITYPGQAAKIPEFIRMAEVRALVHDLHFDDPALEAWVRDRKLSMSSLEYAYESPRIQDVLGLTFDKDGHITSGKPSDGQARVWIYLLERFKAKTLNTRSLEFKARDPKHLEFVADLQAIAGVGVDAPEDSGSGGDGSSSGGGTSGDTTGSNGGPQGGAGGSEGSGGDGEGTNGDGGGGTQSGGGGRQPNRGSTRQRLNVDGFVYRGTSPGMRRRFEELARIDVKEYPNAAHDLLRTVLECSIKDYFRAQGRPIPPKRTVGQCITELVKEFRSDAKMTALINAVNRRGALPAEQYAGTLDSLSASNHEPDHFAVGSDVHEAWDRMKQILITIVG